MTREEPMQDSRPETLAYNDATKVGFIELSTSLAISAEAPDALPHGVKPLITRLRLPRGEVSAAALDEMVSVPRLDEAARELADGGARVVSFACTTGSLIHGPGFDRELVERLERASGVRASTTATALVAALEALGARSVAVATPYVDELNELERKFLEAAGFEVTALRGLSIESDPEIARVPYARTRELALDTAAEGEPDVLFVSCTNLPTLALLDELEQELGRPVISSNAVTIWDALRLADAESGVDGIGSLLAGRATATRAA
jgi:maleate isomerase